MTLSSSMNFGCTLLSPLPVTANIVIAAFPIADGVRRGLGHWAEADERRSGKETVESSSGAGTNLKVGGTCPTRSARNFFIVSSTFLALRVRFGERFRYGQHILASFLLAPRCPRAQPFAKVICTCPPCPMISAPLELHHRCRQMPRRHCRTLHIFCINLLCK